MKITVFNSSPKAGKSNTNAIVEAFLAGAESGGAEVENILLAKLKIKPCSGCIACLVKTPGVCVFDDDVKDLLVKFKESDIVVFATPLYVDNVSGIMKNLMDRMLPLVNPRFELDETGETAHVRAREKEPALAAISNSGFPEQSQFEVLRLLFRRMSRQLRTTLAFEIYRGGGGMIAAKSHPMVGPIIAKYLELVTQAGGEVARDGSISPETMNKLEQPLVPVDIMIANVNMMWEQMIKKNQAKRESAE